MILDRYTGKLVVTPDNSTAGSEGRLYLLLPEQMSAFVGRTYKPLGRFEKDRAVMFTASPSGNTVTPKRQFWWKNGVRDHCIRENWDVAIWVLRLELFVVELISPTGEPAPDLPPYQPTLFE